MGSRSQSDTESPKMEPIRGTGLLGKGKGTRDLYAEPRSVRYDPDYQIL
jgi:hypothetical protein